jgi:fructose-specific phosphotransferase system IIC component
LFGHAVTSKLTISFPTTVIEPIGTPFALHALLSCNGAAEKDMKIYLLMVLIGTLLTAIHFTSAPEQRSKTLPQ